MTRICAVSDLHGNLPAIPDCDVLVIAGDISPYEPLPVCMEWWASDFAVWLTSIVQRGIVPIGIAGNHDFVWQKYRNQMEALHLPWYYLEDEGLTYKGLKFWGSPWQPWFGGFAYNAPQAELGISGEPFLNEKFSMIPSNTDVLITHGPPLGILDRVGGRHVGSSSLSRHVQRVLPKLHVFGHIHVAAGVLQVENVTLCNAALVDSALELVREPVLFDL